MPIHCNYYIIRQIYSNSRCHVFHRQVACIQPEMISIAANSFSALAVRSYGYLKKRFQHHSATLYYKAIIFHLSFVNLQENDWYFMIKVTAYYHFAIIFNVVAYVSTWNRRGVGRMYFSPHRK